MKTRPLGVADAMSSRSKVSKGLCQILTSLMSSAIENTPDRHCSVLGVLQGHRNGRSPFQARRDRGVHEDGHYQGC